MDLEAKPLQYFVTVARENSFSRAALRLNVSQPSLSAQVRELERRLGFDLFTRTSRHVALTRDGRLFLPHALQMVAEAARMSRAASEILKNELRIGAAIYTVLIPERAQLTDDFARAYPHVALHITNRDQARLFRELRRGDIDLALVIAINAGVAEGVSGISWAPSEIVLPTDAQRLDLWERRIQLLIPSENVLAQYDEVPLQALSGAKIAMLGSFHGVEIFDAIAGPLALAGAELVVPPEATGLAVERYGSIMRIPAISVGWFDKVHFPSARGAVRRPIEGLDVTTNIALIRLKGSELRASAKLFWDFAEEASNQPSNTPVTQPH